MKLPRELSEYLKKQKMKRIIPCALMQVLIALVLILWGNTIVRTDVLPFKIAVFVLMLLVPFLVTGVPFKVLQKPWRGEIIKVDIQDGVAFTSDRDKDRPHGTLTIVLTVQADDGKIVIKEIGAGTYTKVWWEPVANTKADHIVDRYQVGDRVFQLGKQYPIIVLPKPEDQHCQCAVCGRTNAIENETCEECGHTLIK
ncbi:MAG: hypothetical protein IJD64_03035 [Clostridia bacterium]|nr:hypothetical protein [Clostridia bacterium]